MEEITVDGNDVEATRRVAGELIERTRRGEGPFLVEALTYRLRGNYVGDPEKTYRAREEVDVWRQKEPLTRTRQNPVSPTSILQWWAHRWQRTAPFSSFV